jgi:hypothetical protein
MSLYVTPVTLPVSPEIVLMRMPFWEFLTSELEKVTVSTTLSDRPPTDPGAGQFDDCQKWNVKLAD